MSGRREIFILFVEQKIEGCDYTIACGRDLLQLKAQNWENALAEAKDIILGDFCSEPEYLGWEDGYPELQRAVLYKANEQVLSIDTMYREAKELSEQHRRQLVELVERTEYERLRIKFGGDG